MTIQRGFGVLRGLRLVLVLGALVIAPVFGSAAEARVHVGFSLNLALPPGVHISVGNYDPYYVGRVFYQPLGVWRPVYSFPVESPYGVVYEPYVYDGGRIVCSDYIPGPDLGYGQFIIEGHGHYNPRWYGGRSFDRYDGRYRYHDRAFYGGDRGWSGPRAYARGGEWYRGHDGGRRGDGGDRRAQHGGYGRGHGGSRGHHGHGD